jgi:hypothetical protein
MNHPEIIVTGETPFDTGERSTYLRYGSLGKMLEGMEKGLSDQSKNDQDKSRVQLAKLGKEAAEKIEEARKIVEQMWRISKPYMKDQDKL